MTGPTTPPRASRTQLARRRAALQLATWLCDHPGAACRATFAADPLTGDDHGPAVPALTSALSETRSDSNRSREQRPGRDS